MAASAAALVAAHCAGLPLALRIAAGLAGRQQGGLSAVAADLAEGGRLDLLDSGDYDQRALDAATRAIAHRRFGSAAKVA